MKYEVGDKLRIVKKEYRQDIYDLLVMKDWVLTIKEVEKYGKIWPVRYYTMKEVPCKWRPEQIEDYEDPINSRFEILDL